MSITARLEGLAETVSNLNELPKATQRNVLRRVLKLAAEPVAITAAQLAPRGETGRLVGAVTVSTQLTRRHRRGAKVNEVETHIGPAAGGGVLNYSSFVEFGTEDTHARPFMRPAWDAKKAASLSIIETKLEQEIEAAARRLARKTARLEAGGG